MFEIEAQPGPQTEFLSTNADMAIYGGAAGGGKTFGILLDPLYDIGNPHFTGALFRRTTVQIRNPGGLWDEAHKIYNLINGAELKNTSLEVKFYSGMKLKFGHLEYDDTVYDWQGSQLTYIGFDELTHFTEKQFWYMVSRNRSMAGIRGRIRATCNPDADSWVKKLISWWLDPDTGLAIPERSGKLRWFIRINEELVFADSAEELLKKYPSTFENPVIPKSLTFIKADIYDNKILMEKDPAYLANLLALPRVERMRLLGANWNVRPAAGMYFQKGWFELVDAAPVGATIRYWDRAATTPKTTGPKKGTTDPDWTVGLKLTKAPNKTYFVEDVVRFRGSPMTVESTVLNIAKQDGYSVMIGIEQDPGSAGVADADTMVKLLAGFNVRVNKPTKDKITRAQPVSAQTERGNVKVLRARWNDAFFTEVENFGDPGLAHDDQVDALSGAFNEIVNRIADDWSIMVTTAPNKFA